MNVDALDSCVCIRAIACSIAAAHKQHADRRVTSRTLGTWRAREEPSVSHSVQSPYTDAVRRIMIMIITTVPCVHNTARARKGVELEA